MFPIQWFSGWMNAPGLIVSEWMNAPFLKLSACLNISSFIVLWLDECS